jgi:RNA polymerase sigma-70 factor (ECF subfamily)
MDDPPEQTAPEARLVARAKTGDLDAFEQLVALHERRVFSLALRLTGSVEDAQDATQEAFLRLHRKIRQIDSGRGVGPWLYSVTVNACRDIGRGRQRSRLVALENWTELAPADAAASPEGIFADRQREEHLRTMLHRLPEKERAALLQREMEGLSTEEVARILGSSESTVRSQICAARLKLRKLLRGKL